MPGLPAAGSMGAPLPTRRPSPRAKGEGAYRSMHVCLCVCVCVCVLCMNLSVLCMNFGEPCRSHLLVAPRSEEENGSLITAILMDRNFRVLDYYVNERSEFHTSTHSLL